MCFATSDAVDRSSRISFEIFRTFRDKFLRHVFIGLVGHPRVTDRKLHPASVSCRLRAFERVADADRSFPSSATAHSTS